MICTHRQYSFRTFLHRFRICIHAYIYICMCLLKIRQCEAYVCFYVYMVYMYIYIYICMCVCVRSYVCIRIYKYRIIYIYTYIYIYTPLQECSGLCLLAVGLARSASAVIIILRKVRLVGSDRPSTWHPAVRISQREIPLNMIYRFWDSIAQKWTGLLRQWLPHTLSQKNEPGK